MAIIIKPKKSETASAVPTTGDLAVGEICINVTDQKIYTKKSDNSIVVVGSVTSGGGSLGANSVGITELDVSDGTAGQMLSTNGSGTLSFATSSGLTTNAVNGTHIALGSDAAGDVMYYNGTDYTRLAKGTAEQVLTMNSGATAPSWVTVAGGVGNAVGISFTSPTIDADITFSAGENGKSDGPLTITVGIAVTISAGSTWTIRD